MVSSKHIENDKRKMFAPVVRSEKDEESAKATAKESRPEALKHSFSSKELQRINQGLPPWESMSFACGGWLQFYMFGVGKALQMCKLDKGVKYLGCSAGALTATGLAFNGDFDDAIQFCKDYCLPTAYSDITGLFKLDEYVTKCIEMTIDPVFYALPEGTLNVAITRLPSLVGERVSSFKTKEDLKLALLCSSAAFPLAPIVNNKGKWYMDGGMSDFQPILNDETITVSPFYFSDCDIKPSRYIPPWWSFLPPRSETTVDWLYNLGFVDCINYLKKRGIYVKEELLNLENKINHPYNTRKNVTLHRFLGYDTKYLTNEFISFFADFILLFLLIFILKPIAIGLIYIELFLRLFFLSCMTVVHSLWEITPRSMIRRFLLKPYMNIMYYFTGGILISQNPILHSQLVNSQRQRIMKKVLWDCIMCVGSLSLLRRFFTGPPSSTELLQHKKLAKHSFLYRIFHHMI